MSGKWPATGPLSVINIVSQYFTPGSGSGYNLRSMIGQNIWNESGAQVQVPGGALSVSYFRGKFYLNPSSVTVPYSSSQTISSPPANKPPIARIEVTVVGGGGGGASGAGGKSGIPSWNGGAGGGGGSGYSNVQTYTSFTFPFTLSVGGGGQQGFGSGNQTGQNGSPGGATSITIGGNPTPLAANGGEQGYAGGTLGFNGRGGFGGNSGSGQTGGAAILGFGAGGNGGGGGFGNLTGSSGGGSGTPGQNGGCVITYYYY